MKNVIISFLTICLVLVSTSIYACGNNPNSIIEGPYKDSAFENGVICFQKTADNRNIEFFQSYYSSQGKVNKKIDIFDYMDAPAEVMSVFFMSIAGKRNVVVLLRWNVNYEVDKIQYPYHYEIKTYQEKNNSGYELNLDSDKDQNLSGYQIKSHGKTIDYLLNDAGKIRKYFHSKYGE